jgi:hypothetical protein
MFGKDTWHGSFNGECKGWSVRFGPGAYRESDFEELMNEATFEEEEVTLGETREPGDLIPVR